MPKIVQTAGRTQLGEFAPQFAALNDDVLFGEVWSDDTLDLKTRSMFTVTTLMAKGLVDASFESHMKNAKKNGISKQEMAAIITHNAFYAGWPNAWAAFRVAAKVYADDPYDLENPAAHGGVFGLGAPNDAYAQYFTGDSYNKLLTPTETQAIANVTFVPGCINHWHVHHADKGGGQILLCTEGRGWCQFEGEEVQEMKPGDVIFVPAGVKHWHGAAKDSWFTHVATAPAGTNLSNEWLEPVDEAEYNKLP